jgi:hypothetical protein
VAGVARWQVCAAARVLEQHGALGAVDGASVAAADRLFDPAAPPEHDPAQRGAIYVTTWIGVQALDAGFTPRPLPSDEQP